MGGPGSRKIDKTGRSSQIRARVHDDNSLSKACDQGKIVGDEEYSQISLLLDAGKQGHDLCLHAHIECRGGLISNKKIWVTYEGHCQHYGAGDIPPENSCGYARMRSLAQAPQVHRGGHKHFLRPDAGKLRGPQRLGHLLANAL